MPSTPAASEEASGGGILLRIRSPKVAALTFSALMVITVPLVLWVLTPERWFELDEWYFVTGQTPTGPANLLTNHNGHWSTVPRLVYHGLFYAFGLHAYRPYQVPTLVAHLAAVALIRVILRRSGVSPWMATLGAGTLLLFGPGAENISAPFQVSFTLTLVFGLGQLLLADHDGAPDRRDLAALLLGLLTIMSSGLAFPMLVATAVAIALRHRSPRVAGQRLAVQVGLPLLTFLVWRPLGGETPAWPRPTVATMFSWTTRQVGATFSAMAGGTIVAGVLLAFVVAGPVLGWRRVGWRAVCDHQRLSIGTGAAALSFAVLTGTSRWFQGLEGAEVSRYLHVGALLFLPALVVGMMEAAAAIPGTWRPRSLLLPAGAVVLLLAPALLNLGRFAPPLASPSIAATIEYVAFAAPRSPVGATSPPWVTPIPDYSIVPFVTLGWLREIDQAGMLPPAPAPNRTLDDQMHVRLGLGQRFAPTDRPCQRTDGAVRVKPSVGDLWGFNVPVTIASVRSGVVDPAVAYTPARGDQLEVLLSDLEFEVRPSGGAMTFCS